MGSMESQTRFDVSAQKVENRPGHIPPKDWNVRVFNLESIPKMSVPAKNVRLWTNFVTRSQFALIMVSRPSACHSFVPPVERNVLTRRSRRR